MRDRRDRWVGEGRRIHGSLFRCGQTAWIPLSDGAVNGQDIDGFVLALFDPAGHAAQYPDCDIRNVDMNHDGPVNGQDIDGFVAVLLGR